MQLNYENKLRRHRYHAERSVQSLCNESVFICVFQKTSYKKETGTGKLPAGFSLYTAVYRNIPVLQKLISNLKAPCIVIASIRYCDYNCISSGYCISLWIDVSVLLFEYFSIGSVC